MVDSKLIYLIKSLGNDKRNGSALIELMDFCGTTRLMDVTQTDAEIFYMLYKNIHMEYDYLDREIGI